MLQIPSGCDGNVHLQQQRGKDLANSELSQREAWVKRLCSPKLEGGKRVLTDPGLEALGIYLVA